MGAIGNQDWSRIRQRILGELRDQGPKTSADLLVRLKGIYAEAAVRMALRMLEDDHLIERETNREPWRLVPRR